jgi:tetratricopeptide (TPR) repeat protein
MKAQPKTNEVLELIFSKITSKQPFSEIEGARIKRDINSLPEFTEIHMSFGSFYTAQGDSVKTIEHFEKAISAPNASSSVYMNYIYSLNCLNLYHDAAIKSSEFADITNSPDIYNSAFCASTLLLDKDIYEKCLGQLNKMNKLHKNNRNNDCIEEMDLISDFVDNNDITSDQIKKIGHIAVQTGQEHAIKMIGNRITHRAERRYLSVDYHIASENCSPSKICDLNYSFIEKLIENDLDELPVTITFIRLSPEKVISNINKGNLLNAS